MKSRSIFIFSIIAVFSFFLIQADDLSPMDNDAKIPEFHVQMGHSMYVMSVAFSPDGKYAITGALDKTIKLWELGTGKELRTIRDSGLVVSVAFTPDGKSILSASGNTLALWDAVTAKEIKKFTGHGGSVLSAAVSRDGKFALSGSADKTLKLWDMASGKEMKTFTGHAKTVLSVALSPDGSFALSASEDKTIKLWDMTSGKEKRTLTGHTGSVRSVAISPDGAFALSGSEDSTLKLWDIAGGREIRTLTGHGRAVTSVAISPDGKFALSGSADSTVKLWELAAGKEVKSLKESVGVMSVAFSPDGKYALSGPATFICTLWELAAGKPSLYLMGYSAPIHAVAFSPDGKYTLAATGNLHQWDMEGGKLNGGKYPVQNESIRSIAVSADGRLVVYGTTEKYLKLRDAVTGNEIKTFTGHNDTVNAVAFSPDARFVLSGSSDKTLKLWDAASGREIKTFTGHADIINSVAFSPDGKFAFSGSRDKTVKSWDIAGGKELKTFAGHSMDVLSVAVSPDGKFALSGSFDKTLKLWNAATGREVKTFTGHTDFIHAVAFSPDGRYALSGSWDFSLKLWDVAGGREVRSYTGHAGFIDSVAFSPDGKYALSGSWDGTMRLWNIKTGEWTAFACTPLSTNWIIFTNDGYWDGSINAALFVTMVRGLEWWRIDQFAVRNNRPDIILQRLGSRDSELIKHYYNQFLKRLRKLGFSESGLSADYNIPTAGILEAKQDGKFVNLKFSLADGKFMLKSYNIYINDVPLFGAYGEQVDGNARTLAKRIELISGDNKIEISCMNEKGAESYRALVFANHDQKTKGDLYFIGFGVSTYKNRDLNLQFAHKDALDLADCLRNMKGQFENVFVYTFTNEQVTVENIRKAKDLLKNAKVDDTFVLFISGHGIHDKDAEATYYYVTHEADVNNIAKTCANFEIIEDMLQGIAPRNKLFLMDTCESGEVETEASDQYFILADKKGIKPRTSRDAKGLSLRERRRPVRSYLFDRARYIYNDLLRRSGAIVFSSCRGGEFSYEDERIKNGFFTSMILEGLSKKSADKDNNGMISIDELRNYVSSEVPKLTADERHPEGVQHPTVDRDNIYQKFGFVRLDDIQVTIQKGIDFASQSRYDEAKKSFEYVIEKCENDRDRAFSYFCLGFVYDAQKQFDPAIDCYKKSIELFQKIKGARFDFVYSSLATSYFKRKSYDKAIENYKKYIEINPGANEGYSNLGYVYFNQGNYGTAITYFEKAIKINNKHADSYAGLAVTYYKMNNFTLAKENYLKAIEINGNYRGNFPELEKQGLFFSEIEMKAFNELMKAMGIIHK